MVGKREIIIIAILAILVIFTTGACVPNQGSDSPEISSGDVTYTPDSDSLEVPNVEVTGENIKLGQYLTELLLADEQGNATEYAQKYRFIEITDETNVKVVVEAYPNSVDQALESVKKTGTIIGTYKTYIDATIAMDDIPALVSDPAISIIRLPHVATDSSREQWDETQRIKKISNPKLYSPLNLLVLPENQGKTGEIIEKNNIELLPGERLRLVIEADPEHVEEAIEFTSQYGEVESVWEDLIQIVVPIQYLEELTESPTVQNVRLPYEFWIGDE